MNPGKETAVTDSSVFRNSSENLAGGTSLFWHRRQEFVGIGKDNIHLILSKSAFALWLFLMEALESNFTSMVQDEWCLSYGKSTNSGKSTSLLELESTLNKFQKT